MKFEVRADMSRFGRAIDQLYSCGADMAPLMEQIGELAMSEFAEGFQTAGFGKWPPLTLFTRRLKERKFPGAPIMVRTGTLRDSLIKRGATDNIFEVTPLGVQVGTAVPYAYKQHDGLGGTPGRPIVFVTPGLEAGAADLAEAYLAQQVST